MTLERVLRARPGPTRPTVRVERPGRTALICAAMFLAARAVTSAFMLWMATRTTAASEAGASPSFARLSSVWDGFWYRRIALHGYPLHLPVDAHGHVEQNAWAFLPGYPVVTRLVSSLTGSSWAVSALSTAVLFGVGAAVLLGVLLAPHVGSRGSLFAVALFSFSPVSFMLQMAYADSMMLCLLLGALCLLDRGRSGWAIPLVVAASLTRPGVLAIALTVAVHLVRQWRAERRWSSGRVQDLLLLLTSCAGGLAWPVVVGLVTGRADAYIRTETAWRALWTGSADFSLFRPWLFVAQQLFGIAGAPVLGLLVGVFCYIVARPAARVGWTSRVWIASYGLYLLAVFMPQTSLPRLLLPMSPALGAVPVPRRWTTVVAVLAVSTAVQLAWLWCTYGPVKTYLTVP